MNCFQLVKVVLDEVYDQIPLRGEARKDGAIREELASLGRKYRNLLGGSTIDYENPVTRFAYIYRYVTSHANIVYELIRNSNELSELFDSAKINVACIGGGPGSDLLGILKFMINDGKNATLRCMLYDKEQAWSDSWNDIDDKLGTPFRISVFFQSFDITTRATWIRQTKYLNSDLFTMVYFMSEVYKFKVEAEPFFANMLNEAKSGALFLYVDNNNPAFYKWFDSLAEASPVEVIKSRSRTLGIDWHEEKRDLGRYYEKFGSPKLDADVAYRICRKH